MITNIQIISASQLRRRMALIFLYCFFFPILARSESTFISQDKAQGCFTLSESGKSAPVVISAADYPGVLRVARIFQDDIERVTKNKPEIRNDVLPEAKEIILIGTLGKNQLIDQLVASGKIQVKDIAGQWESTLIQVVEKPFKGVDKALVIAGSDKRGTIYGMFDLSRQIGVSPWAWWADVPVESKTELYVLPGRFVQSSPKVKYRGIFLNDEEPCLGRWAVENYGGFNHQFYEKVFELILRLRGNFLWPAMWWGAFNSDDPENPRLADEMGIVMSTSHHEPMLRSQQEWKREGSGAWNYETNGATLREFWRQGIRNMGSHESIVTLAMRGDGDMAMSEGTNIALLEKIVADQRDILANETGKDVATIPQVWALYKEVQDYYDKGMRVPDDVTLLLCDDNWGNVRRLPNPSDPPRAGGYGMYYHFDFVGGPRNYKWVNTNQIARIWEQMNLTYRYGVDRIWLVNVGDLKPMEFPISFFLDYAWDPDAWPAERLPEYTRLWAEEQFGPAHADDIAYILTKYTRYNRRRTPEMLAPDTYSLVHYREWETVAANYNALAEKAEQIKALLPSEYQDAYYQLVLHPVTACANLNELYFTVAKNHWYAQQGRATTHDLAQKAKDLFEKDAEISHYYNKVLAGGKWNHMMDQTHIGYTYWQQPDKNSMPEVKEIDIPKEADMGVAVEGAESWWPEERGEAVLPEFDPYNRQSHFIDVFNRGKTAFDYTVELDAPWLTVTSSKGTVDKEQRLRVSVDWGKVPSGEHRSQITIHGPGSTPVIVHAVVLNPKFPKPDRVEGFVQANGVVSIEAEHYSNLVNGKSVQWLRIPDLGRTLSAMTPMPVTASAQTPAGDSPRLEYKMYLFGKGEVEVSAYLAPTQNFNDTEGLRYAVSFDDDPPQTVNMHSDATIPDWKYPLWWNEAVGRSIKVTTSKHVIEKPGEHTLKFWMVDPGIVLQKLVVDLGGEKPSYLGPPESFYRIGKPKK